MGTYITSERRDAVALVTIDNPPMNALSAALLEELEAEVEALDADDEVRAIVLRGGGERAFVAGADIKEFPALRESAAEGGSARGIQRVGQRMDAAHTPFVAAIRGFCLGGGLELAMCCDVRVCSDDATARPAGDQARADPRGRRHAAAAAARRHRTRDVPQPDGRLRRRGDRVRLGSRRARSSPSGSSRRRRSPSPAASRPSRRTRWRCCASSRGRRATSRSRRGSGVRRTASSAACAPTTGPRGSPRSSRSGRPASRAAR